MNHLPRTALTSLLFLILLISVLSLASESERGWYLQELNTSEHWEESIHAQAGIDCHGCHVPTAGVETKAVDWPSRSTITVPLLTRKDYDERCQTCHAKATQSYQHTFHGKHGSLGKKNVPTCSFCHAGHERPLDSELNPLHETNISLVCAGCHSADSEVIHAAIINEGKADTHLNMHRRPEQLKIAGLGFSSWINGFYIFLLVSVLGFFCVYFILDIPYTLRQKNHHEHKSFLTARTLVILHFLFASAFIVLAATGFTIKYPESTFSHMMMSLISDPDIRSIIHRFAAIVFVGSAYSFFLVAIIKRFHIRSMLPKRSDLSSIQKALKKRVNGDFTHEDQHTEKTKTAISWITKFEFWSSVIGVHIVLITGLLMWFMEWTLAYASYGAFKYAQLIHGWEAILATCTLLLVHGFIVVVRPFFLTRRKRNGNKRYDQ